MLAHYCKGALIMATIWESIREHHHHSSKMPSFLRAKYGFRTCDWTLVANSLEKLVLVSSCHQQSCYKWNRKRSQRQSQPLYLNGMPARQEHHSPLIAWEKREPDRKGKTTGKSYKLSHMLSLKSNKFFSDNEKKKRDLHTERLLCFAKRAFFGT